MADNSEFYAHLATACTTLCRCWSVVRRDGEAYGFTDHDQDLSFEGYDFSADSGMTASAIEQSTGLSVDNTEALGALSSSAITEADIRAGRFDGATVKSWMANWADTSQRALLFSGNLGEITRVAGGFQAELRGLTEALNQPQGRVYQSTCSCVVGEDCCGTKSDELGYYAEIAVETVEGGKHFNFTTLSEFDDRWFEYGRFEVLTGAATGLIGLVKNDRLGDASRQVELWEDLRATIVTGDMVRLEAGNDRTAETARLKFDNFEDYRGFPHIPGEDWLSSYPVSSDDNDGGSLNSSSSS